MKKHLLVLAFVFLSLPFCFGQGVFISPQTAFRTVNGVTSPIANATVTVCAAGASGIPCSPALVNAIFKDAGLTQSLSNPFFADANGNYQFAAAPGIYTVTTTSAGFAGYSYQVTLAAGAGSILFQTNGTNNGSQSKLNLSAGTGISLADNGLGMVTITNTGGGGGSGITGSGTAPFFPVWTGTSTQGNSPLSNVTGPPAGVNYNIGGGFSWQLDASGLNFNTNVIGSSNVLIQNSTNPGSFNNAGGIIVKGADTGSQACAGAAILKGGQTNTSANGAIITAGGGCANGFGAGSADVTLQASSTAASNGGGNINLIPGKGGFGNGTINFGIHNGAPAVVIWQNGASSSMFEQIPATVPLQWTFTWPNGPPASNGFCLAATTAGISSWVSCAGLISSVSNSDSTLTISPTTGAVVASLNLANPNTWTGLQTFGTHISIGNINLGTPTAINLANAAAASLPITAISATGTPSSSTFLRGDGTWSASGAGGSAPGGATDALQYNAGSGLFGGVNSPTVNGNYLCGFNVTAAAAVIPSCNLAGVAVNTPTTPYTMLYSDRASYQRLTGGSAFSINLPQITGNVASNFPFVTQNGNSGNETLTANAVDKIDGSSTGGSSTILPNFAAFVYQDQSSAPGNWWTIKFPTFAAFGSNCPNGVTWSTTTGFSCLSAAPVKSGDTAGGALGGTYPNPTLANATGCTNQVVTAISSSTAAGTCSNVVGAMMTNNTVTATQLAAQYSKGSCTEVWSGSGTSSALQSGDDAISNNTCFNDSGVTRTITAVKCRSNVASNTTTVNPTFGSAGTGTTILSGALTCGSSFAYSSSGTVTNASWTTGSGIDPAMGGTLTGASIAMIVEYTY